MELDDSKIGALAAWMWMTFPIAFVLGRMELFIERNR